VNAYQNVDRYIGKGYYRIEDVDSPYSAKTQFGVKSEGIDEIH
jgi:hypothetical protein